MKNIQWPERYLAWDLETSGLDPARDRILEIGAVLVDKGEVVERRSWVLDNGIDVPPEITAINGITNEIVRAEGRPPRECLREFAAMFGMKEGPAIPHLTHNGVRFDIPFLAEQLSQQFGLTNEKYRETIGKLYASAVDSAVLVKAGKLGMPRMWNEDFKAWADRVMAVKAYGVKYNVGLCCDELKIDRSKVTQHRATGDVELTVEIYKSLTKQE